MKLDIFQKKNNIIKSDEEIKAILKSKADPNCKNCYGRGYLGYKEIKKKLLDGRIIDIKRYIKCEKCIKK